MNNLSLRKTALGAMTILTTLSTPLKSAAQELPKFVDLPKCSLTRMNLGSSGFSEPGEKFYAQFGRDANMVRGTFADAFAGVGVNHKGVNVSVLGALDDARQTWLNYSLSLRQRILKKTIGSKTNANGLYVGLQSAATQGLNVKGKVVDNTIGLKYLFGNKWQFETGTFIRHNNLLKGGKVFGIEGGASFKVDDLKRPNAPDVKLSKIKGFFKCALSYNPAITSSEMKVKEANLNLRYADPNRTELKITTGFNF